MMRVYPDRDGFKDLAARGNLVPVWTELLADLETPVSAYARVRDVLRSEDKASHSYLLESVEGGEKIGRYSFIGGKPRAIIRAYGRRAEIEAPGRDTVVWDDIDPLAAVKRYMERFKQVPDPALPRFTGGAVGFIGYDCVGQFERVATRDDDALRAPDLVFMVTDALIVFDRVRHTIRIVANAFIEDGLERAYDAALATIEHLYRALTTPISEALIDPRPPEETPEPRSNFSRDDFAAAVERTREYIRAGDVIQTVLSQRFEVDFAGDSLDLYRALRSINPSPYMFCLDLGESAMVGSSPEIHVRCEDGRVEVRPIAGTRPRGGDEQEDLRLERELLADPKERAEHIMLVDLARNDIGRVCDYDTVAVPELMVVERYSHVMHIVSDVVGRLADGYDGYDVMRATFPAGTVSGAPKVRAMEIIAELEHSKRGPYAGAVGYFNFNGNLDSCITIRTIILDEGKAFVQAGAGIVADSDPEKEYEETRNKARGMLKAIALAQRFADTRNGATQP
jgi:anthranilate synthase component I